MRPVDVFDLEQDEQVSCYYCSQDRKNMLYGRGEAFLAGPDHPPYDGNANHICRKHLSPEALLPTGTLVATERTQAGAGL
jgi:hypothetical protein